MFKPPEVEVLTNSVPRFWNCWPSLEAVAGFAGFGCTDSLFASPSQSQPLLQTQDGRWRHFNRGRSWLEAQPLPQNPPGQPGYKAGGRLTSLMAAMQEMFKNYFLNNCILPFCYLLLTSLPVHSALKVLDLYLPVPDSSAQLPGSVSVWCPHSLESKW